MKKTTIVLAILGGLVALALGGKWVSDASKYQETIAKLSSMGADTSEIASLKTAGYLLMLGVAIAVAGVVLIKKGRPRLAGGIMLAGGIAPVMFATKALVGTAVLLLAGALALTVKKGVS